MAWPWINYWQFSKLLSYVLIFKILWSTWLLLSLKEPAFSKLPIHTFFSYSNAYAPGTTDHNMSNQSPQDDSPWYTLIIMLYKWISFRWCHHILCFPTSSHRQKLFTEPTSRTFRRPRMTGWRELISVVCRVSSTTIWNTTWTSARLECRVM